MNGYADDLAALIERSISQMITMVGHSTGGGKLHATSDGTVQRELPQPF